MSSLGATNATELNDLLISSVSEPRMRREDG